MFSSRDIRLIESLRLNPSRSFRGATKGERVSKRKGISIEFAEYRPYTDGDDLRHLDWNVLARLESPVLRTYQDEEDLVVYLVVDNSESMAFGEPEKRMVAQRLATAIAHSALNGGDGVRLVNGSLAGPPSAIVRGRSAARRIAGRLTGMEVGNREISAALRSLLSGSIRSGLVVLVSDGLDPELPAAIRSLGGRGFEVWLAQVLDEAELDPDLEGDLRLIDAENAAVAEITINRDTLAHYRSNLGLHNQSLQASCLRTGGRYALVKTSESLEFTLSRNLKPGRWFS